MRLGSLTEVATELGLPSEVVEQRWLQGLLPDPITMLGIGPIWDLDQIGVTPSPPTGTPFVSGPGVLVFGHRFFAEESEHLGEGGFADVYRATDTTVSRYDEGSIIAIKVLKSISDEVIRKRFQRELRIVSRLRHDHVMPILESGTTPDDRLWYAMPLATGSLQEELASFLHDDDLILDTMEQVCKGVAYLHEEGIVHRDLSPANILRTKVGNWAIADFGLAREEHRLTASITTTHGGGFGTFRYAAPELMDDAKNADARADIFALGRILCALVRGEPPSVYEAPPPGIFRSVIQMATQIDRNDRYQEISALVEDMRRAVGAPAMVFTDSQTSIGDLAARLKSEIPDVRALDEFLKLIMGPDGHLVFSEDEEAFAPLRTDFFRISTGSIQHVCETSPIRFRSIIRQYADYVRGTTFRFDFCDVIADFFERVIAVTMDADLLRETVWTLAELGARHNRWHVRSVLRSLLQRVQDADGALSAAHGLRASRPSSRDWVLSDFAIRSLHPSLRDAISALRDTDGASGSATSE